MFGAIAGDIIGAPFEFAPKKSTDFPLFSSRSEFTDDTVLTIAVADALLNNLDLVDTLKHYTNQYPHRGYGGSYKSWAASDSKEPYNSWGNGSAMRTSAVGLLFSTRSEILDAARECAAVTHNHPHGIHGAQAVALSIFMARQGASKKEIRAEISQLFGYDLNATIDQIRPAYAFNESCQGSVPQSIIAFLESTDFEDAIRLAVSLGGDADTMACIAGGIAEAFYGGVPDHILQETKDRLPQEFLSIIEQVYRRAAA